MPAELRWWGSPPSCTVERTNWLEAEEWKDETFVKLLRFVVVFQANERKRNGKLGEIKPSMVCTM
jgi:hypothetical protein